MAFNNRINGALQRLKIKAASQPERLRHVVLRAAPLKLVNKPETPLRIGERDTLWPRLADQRSTNLIGFADMLGQQTNRWRFKQRAQRKFNSKARSDLTHQPRCQQRMTA